MKRIGNRMKLLIAGALVLGTLGIGAAEAFGVNQATGCRIKAGCRYGGYSTGACCYLP